MNAEASISVGAAPWWRRRFVCGAPVAMALTVAVALSMMAAPSTGQALEGESLSLQVGGTTGASWNQLSRPMDPEGSYTLLWGSAFTGYGGLVGATGQVELARVDGTSINVATDVLYGYHRGDGYAADDETGGRIDVKLSTHKLRVPLMVRVKDASRTTGPTLAAGIEPSFGVRSAATVTLTDIDDPIQPLETTPTVEVAGVVELGFDIDVDDYIVPLAARVVWNPFVPNATEDRFEGFDSPQQPGDYRVEFDVQIMVMAGVRWSLDLE